MTAEAKPRMATGNPAPREAVSDPERHLEKGGGGPVPTMLKTREAKRGRYARGHTCPVLMVSGGHAYGVSLFSANWGLG